MRETANKAFPNFWKQVSSACVCSVGSAWLQKKPLKFKRTLKQIFKLVEGYTFGEEPVNPIHCEWQEMDTGKIRLIVRFCLKAKAQQVILTHLLCAAGHESDIDYTAKGAGGEKALLLKICRHLMGDFPYWSAPDITNCYPSLRRGHFNQLPVPGSIRDRVAFVSEGSVVEVSLNKMNADKIRMIMDGQFGISMGSSLDDIKSATIKMVRQGLPTGSACSPILVRWFVKNAVLNSISGDEVVLSYLDNLAIGATTKEGAKLAVSNLQSLLQSHPAGPIHLHDTAVHENFAQGYLGYVIEPGKGYGDNPVHVKPGKKRTNIFKTRLRILLDSSEVSPFEAFDLAEEYRKRWFGAQAAWTKVPGASDGVSAAITASYVADYLAGIPMGTWQLNKSTG